MRHFSDPAYDIDDIKQDIALALWSRRLARPSKRVWRNARASIHRRRVCFHDALKHVFAGAQNQVQNRLDSIDRHDEVAALYRAAFNDRQRQILDYLKDGFAVRAIARLLRIAPSTVCADISAIRNRFRA